MNKQTHEMINRLINLGISMDDAYQLRRIAMTLHRWFELECGGGNNWGSWAIVRGRYTNRGKEFEHDDDGKAFIERHHYTHGQGKDYTTYTQIPDREAGARKRLAKIMAKYTGLQYYVQTDPRGAPLYIGKDLTDGCWIRRGPCALAGNSLRR